MQTERVEEPASHPDPVDPPRLSPLGQIEGGSAQGIGFARLEEVVMRDGKMANAQLTNYIIPPTLDTPRFDIVGGHAHTYDWFCGQGYDQLTQPLVDPVWKATWDFSHEAAIAGRIRSRG